MLKKSIFIILIFLSTLYCADDNTLLNDQLEAINRQLGSSNQDSDKLNLEDESAYKYNQNAIYQNPNYVKERFYIGANGFFGSFDSRSNDSNYNVKESTTFTNLKIGYIFKTNNRLELVLLEGTDLSYTSFTNEMSGVNLNLILPFVSNRAKNIHIKVQGGVGLYSYSDFSMEGISASAAFGIIGDITNDIEIDISYLYQYVYWRDFKHITDSTYISSTSFNGMLFGIKYKF